jgi:hypothetical protein
VPVEIPDRNTLSQTTEDKITSCVYNTRIQKGGALIDEMRQLVRAWQDAPLEQVRDAVVRANLLNKRTRARASDILRRTYIPRFVGGPIPNAWKLVRPLEDAGASPQLVRPVYYWISAQAEPMIADFCREFLFGRMASARAGVELREVTDWLNRKGCEWSPIVLTKVGRGLLAGLRDFGVLEGRSKKHVSALRLQIGSFAYLAFCWNQLGSLGRNLVFHRDWQLFLLQTPDVEHYFLEAHQHRLLEYHAAGSTVSISFPCRTMEEYAQFVVDRSN